MPVAHCADSDVYYEDTGGDGPAVILAHGFAMDHTMFAGQAALAPRWRVITWDARGHGGTEDRGNPFTYWDLARDLLALMDELDVPRASIGGVSQGGFVSLRAGLLAPERVERLLLFDTEAGECGAADLAAYSAMFDTLAQRGPVRDLLVPLAAQIIGDAPTVAAHWIDVWGERGVPLGEAPACLLGRDDIIARLPEINIPALLVRGDHDESIPAERMRILEHNLPNATRIHVVPGAGHSPPLTHPEQSNEILRDYLADSI